MLAMIRTIMQERARFPMQVKPRGESIDIEKFLIQSEKQKLL